MKTLFLSLFLYFAISIFYSCGDDSTTNNTICDMSINLISPPTDTTFYFHPDSQYVWFRWTTPCKTPSFFLIEERSDSVTNPNAGNELVPSNYSNWLLHTDTDSIWHFWRIKCIDQPNTDTFYTEWRKYRFYAN